MVEVLGIWAPDQCGLAPPIWDQQSSEDEGKILPGVLACLPTLGLELLAS